MSDGTTVTAQVMTDNWGQVIKIGKRRTDVAGSARSNYFLSPYSLGVTYIPKDVVKETFIANLDTMCRLNKLASGTTIDMTDTDVVSTLNSATGCIKDGNGNETNIYPAGGDVSQQHTVGANENIINDGMIEYDLNSVTMKVEYFVVDLWDTNNYKILNTAVGEVGKSYSEVSGLVNKLTRNVENYRDNNTGYNFLNGSVKTYKVGSRTANLAAGYERNQGRALIARVSVRMKVHIPYTNALIQWGVYKHTHHSDVEHYDIKMYNADATNVSNFMDGIVGTEDGLWYQTSTYYAVTR